MSQNIRRNKDNSDLPPPYFYGSGDIPTETSSPYHNNLPGGATAGYSGGLNTSIYGGESGGMITGGTSTVSISQTDGLMASTSMLSTPSYSTEPKYNNDGAIGTLYVESTGKTIDVYEGEDLSNLKKGAGHFTSTSAWDGNVALCGHNRGSSAYFSFVKELENSDRITYTTPYGSREYEVFHKENIDEYDHSLLGWSAENILTLITCIEDTPEQRWAAQLREVR
jgi:sortase A